MATTGGGGDDGGGGGAAAALPRKKQRRAKGSKTHNQRDAARRASGDPVLTDDHTGVWGWTTRSRSPSSIFANDDTRPTFVIAASVRGC
eukprot:scaffold20559_cov97-Phaeocystis_antarctica.AAC.1